MNRDNYLGFLLGLGAGVAAGLIFAPMSGPDTRRTIARTARDTTGAVKEQAASLWGSATDAVENGKAGLARVQQSVMGAVDAGKKAYRESTEMA